MLLGTLLGKLMDVRPRPAFLISTGTAICGGSAIAAVGPITGATEDEMSVSLGTVFVLNSVALLTFPAIGLWLHLSQTQFGLWAALAIHDTSSVVGAAAKYGAVALAVGTTVKLARALWIVPLSIGTAAVKGSKTRIQWPWFILFFCLAAVANTYFFPGATRLSLAEQSREAHAGHHLVSDRREPVACSRYARLVLARCFRASCCGSSSPCSACWPFAQAGFESSPNTDSVRNAKLHPQTQLRIEYDGRENSMNAPISSEPQPKRGFLLRILYRVYTNYLGVTPPTPAQERIAAAVLIGGTVVGLIAIVALVLFLWQTLMKMGGQ